MSKTEERVTINEQNKAENNNTICFLKNTDMYLFFFSRNWDVALVWTERSICLPIYMLQLLFL